MRKIIAAACLMAAMTLCVGCSSAKDGSKDTTKATTETKMKVQSKYKVPKITAAKKTDQLADAQKELTEAERGVSDAQLEVSKAQSD